LLQVEQTFMILGESSDQPRPLMIHLRRGTTCR
jgi:hypothetical protein